MAALLPIPPAAPPRASAVHALILAPHPPHTPPSPQRPAHGYEPCGQWSAPSRFVTSHASRSSSPDEGREGGHAQAQRRLVVPQLGPGHTGQAPPQRTQLQHRAVLRSARRGALGCGGGRAGRAGSWAGGARAAARASLARQASQRGRNTVEQRTDSMQHTARTPLAASAQSPAAASAAWRSCGSRQGMQSRADVAPGRAACGTGRAAAPSPSDGCLSVSSGPAPHLEELAPHRQLLWTTGSNESTQARLSPATWFAENCAQPCRAPSAACRGARRADA
jgi:hypothetical protein